MLLFVEALLELDSVMRSNGELEHELEVEADEGTADVPAWPQRGS